MTDPRAGATTALRIGAWLLVVAGLLSGILAVVPVATGGTTRRQVVPDRPVPLPSPGFFGPPALVLYAATDGRRPAESELGCSVRDDENRVLGARVSSLGAFGAGTRRVEGAELTPVATVRGFRARSTLTCSGPAIRSAQPVWLLADKRRAIPTGAAAGFAVVALLFGSVAMRGLRTSNRR